MIKWLGAHIYHLVSRFRNQVYLENVQSSTQTRVLVVSADGLITYNSNAGGGGDTIVAGEGIDISGTGNVTVRGEDASVLNKGIASFNDDDFIVSNGAVSSYRYHWHMISYYSVSAGYVYLPNNNIELEASSGEYYTRIIMPYAGRVFKLASKTLDTANRQITITMHKGGTDFEPLNSQTGTTFTRNSGQDQVAGTFNQSCPNDWTFAAGDLLYFKRRDNISGGPQHVNMTITFQYSI